MITAYRLISVKLKKCLSISDIWPASEPDPVFIKVTRVEHVHTYEYLAVTFEYKLSWSYNNDLIMKKQKHGLFHLSFCVTQNM